MLRGSPECQLKMGLTLPVYAGGVAAPAGIGAVEGATRGRSTCSGPRYEAPLITPLALCFPIPRPVEPVQHLHQPHHLIAHGLQLGDRPHMPPPPLVRLRDRLVELVHRRGQAPRSLSASACFASTSFSAWPCTSSRRASVRNDSLVSCPFGIAYRSASPGCSAAAMSATNLTALPNLVTCSSQCSTTYLLPPPAGSRR